MKASLVGLASFMLLVHFSSALAASSTDLSVTGTLMPSSCTVSLSNGGETDYGKWSFADLKPDGWTRLPETMLQVRVSCEEVTSFTLTPVDNRPELLLPVDIDRYGLGVVGGNTLLGTYLLKLLRPVVDGKAVDVLRSIDGGNTWTVVPPGWSWTPTALTAFGDDWWAGIPLPIASKEMTADLYVLPSISPSNTLPTGQPLPLDGSMTVQLSYR